MTPPTFAELGLPAPLLATVAALGFDAPLPVQTRAIPALLAGEDVVISAETGSGKTLAYVLPLVARHAGDAPAAAPRVLVLTPTRELAAQVARVFEDVGAAHGLVVVTAHGGTPVRLQVKSLAQGAHVVVATPGRLRDLARRAAFVAGDLRAVVVDEADRMLAPDFAPHVQRIIALAPADAQLVLLSATVNNRVLELASGRLANAVRVHGELEDDRAIPPGIVHTAIIVRQPLKRLLLAHVLAADPEIRPLVFVSSRFRCRALAESLAAAGITAESLSGGRQQRDREAALESFRTGAVRVLVATDLAERGLDLAGLTHVVNFDLPKQVTGYAHRVGRTARAFGDGVALSLVTPPEKPFLDAVRSNLGVALDLVHAPGFDHDQRPTGLDPLVETEKRRGKSDDETPAKKRPRRGTPDAQKKAFWDRAVTARTNRARRKGRGPIKPGNEPRHRKTD